MPRVYDFGSNTSDKGSLFATFSIKVAGNGEISDEEMFAIFFNPNSPRHQFEYKPNNPEIKYYENASIDPMFDWLNSNATGKWHWFEDECNHGHSVSIDIWIDDDNLAEKFANIWADRIFTRDYYVEHNRARKEKNNV